MKEFDFNLCCALSDAVEGKTESFGFTLCGLQIAVNTVDAERSASIEEMSHKDFIKECIFSKEGHLYPLLDPLDEDAEDYFLYLFEHDDTLWQVYLEKPSSDVVWSASRTIAQDYMGVDRLEFDEATQTLKLYEYQWEHEDPQTTEEVLIGKITWEEALKEWEIMVNMSMEVEVPYRHANKEEAKKYANNSPLDFDLPF